jgi:hypothetical protein
MRLLDLKFLWGTRAGLPDGNYIFRPKIAIWAILEGLAMEDVR